MSVSEQITDQPGIQEWNLGPSAYWTAYAAALQVGANQKLKTQNSTHILANKTHTNSLWNILWFYWLCACALCTHNLSPFRKLRLWCIMAPNFSMGRNFAQKIQFIFHSFSWYFTGTPNLLYRMCNRKFIFIFLSFQLIIDQMKAQGFRKDLEVTQLVLAER